MNVAILASHVTPTFGLEQCVLRLARELGAPVVCIGQPEEYALPTAVALSSLGSSLRGRHRLASLSRLRRWSGSQSGVVVVAGVWAALPLLACRRKLPFRVIVWEHSLSAENVAATPRLGVLRRLAAHLYGRADLIVCVSDDLAAQVREIAGTVPVVTIANFLPVGRKENRPKASRAAGSRTNTRLLSIGALTAVKNHQLTIRAMTYLPANIHLDILGQGGLRTELESLASDLGVADRVTFHGFVTDPNSHYVEADVVVLPSLGETFGLAMFEAAHHHVPLVAVDFPLARQLVGHYLVGRLTPNEPQQLAHAVLATLADMPDEALFRLADQRRRTDFDAKRITEAWRLAITGDVERLTAQVVRR